MRRPTTIDRRCPLFPRRLPAALVVATWALAAGGRAPAADAAAADPAARPARVLAVTVTVGYRHSSIGTAEAVLEELGRSSGLFHVDFLRMPPGRLPQPRPPRREQSTGDAEWRAQQEAYRQAEERFRKDDAGWQEALTGAFARAFSAESLAGFDGVMFVNTTGDLPVPDLAAFLDWVKSGKSFVGIHGATGTFKSSDDFSDFIGGIFAGHPWTADAEHAFVVHESSHRLTAMFPPRFRWQDEIYQYDGRFKPENVRVLLSLDMPASNPREPWHVPVSWVRDYGQGRLFYTSLGHNDATWREERFQKHLLEGIAWSLGRFDAPAEANPAVQAAEYLRSVVAAAASATGRDVDELVARAEARIARDADWAVGLRPMLLEIRGMGSEERAAAYAKVLAEIGR
jgi:type 1 glutamine amidotransferase